MISENQVCSLELAKKLKELGVKQESLWWWRYRKEPKPFWHLETFNCEQSVPKSWVICQDEISAFTVAELGEMLPIGFTTYFDGQGWYALGTNPPGLPMPGDFKGMCIHSDTEANCRAKILIWLIEHGKLNLQTI